MPETRSRIRLVAAVSAAAFVLLGALAVWLSAPGIEADLQARAEAALKAGRFEGVAVALDGRDATLSGYAEDEAARQAALAAVAAVAGVRSVGDSMQSPGAAEAPSLYRFTVLWDGRRASLTGYMPSRDAREETVTFVRDTLPGSEIVDGLQVAPGAPDENWQAIAAAGIAAMKPLVSATLSMNGVKVAFTGVAGDAAAREASAKILNSLPSPYVSSIDIAIGEPAPTPPPGYGFGAAYDGVSLALSGAVPSEAVRAAFVARLKALFPEAALDDRTRIDPAAPDGAWADAAGLALAQFARAKTATLKMNGRALELGVVVSDAAARNGVRNALHDLPVLYVATLTLTVAGAAPAAYETMGGGDTPAARCQAAFDAALAKDRIAFAPSSAKLPDSAGPLIDALAGIAASCPDARLEVAGHTDASGREAANQTLSEGRAEAVAAALKAKGVDEARLAAKGYGAARPIAANDSDEGKARNRRIEVIVRP